MNPDSYIRQAYIQGLATATGLPVYHKRIPVDVEPLPTTYILITTQTKNETEVKGKQLTDELTAARCTEWLTSIVVDIIRVNEMSFTSYVTVEAVEDDVINWVRTQLQVDGFYVKQTEITDSISLDADTETVSIDRKVLTVSHWVNER